jgi:hypothetical protein
MNMTKFVQINVHRHLFECITSEDEQSFSIEQSLALALTIDNQGIYLPDNISFSRSFLLLVIIVDNLTGETLLGVIAGQCSQIASS